MSANNWRVCPNCKGEHKLEPNPCQICGATAVVSDSWPHWSISCSDINCVLARTNNCYPTRREAIVAWNRRKEQGQWISPPAAKTLREDWEIYTTEFDEDDPDQWFQLYVRYDCSCSLCGWKQRFETSADLSPIHYMPRTNAQ